MNIEKRTIGYSDLNLLDITKYMKNIFGNILERAQIAVSGDEEKEIRQSAKETIAELERKPNILDFEKMVILKFKNGKEIILRTSECGSIQYN